MTEHEKRIREALEAGPTEGVWHWHGDPVKGDPTGRVRFEVVTSGKTITRIYYSSYEGGPTNAGQDAAFIAACNPAAIRALLADLDAVRADAQRYRLLRRGQHWSVVDGVGDILRAEELDARIDAALKGASHE